MVLHKFKIDLIMLQDLVFILPGRFLQIIINVDRLIGISKMFKSPQPLYIPIYMFRIYYTIYTLRVYTELNNSTTTLLSFDFDASNKNYPANNLHKKSEVGSRLKNII